MVIEELPILGNLKALSLACLVVLSGLFFLLNSATKSQLPLVNGKRQFEFGIAKARQRYLKDAHNLITSGLAKVCFAVLICKIVDLTFVGSRLPCCYRKWC